MSLPYYCHELALLLPRACLTTAPLAAWTLPYLQVSYFIVVLLFSILPLFFLLFFIVFIFIL